MVTSAKTFVIYITLACTRLGRICGVAVPCMQSLLDDVLGRMCGVAAPCVQSLLDEVDTDSIEHLVNMCVHCSKECAVPLRKTLRCIIKTYTRVDVWRLYDGYTSDSDKAAEVTPHGAKWQEPCTTNVKAIA